MRVPVEDAIHGGNSDCRNRNLQTMFDLIGYGERAGRPSENLPELERTTLASSGTQRKIQSGTDILVMRMMSLLPDAVMKSLKSRFGSEFNELSKEQKLALATVAIEGSVTHARIKEISDIHPHDLSKELKDLVTHGFLQSAGATRAMVYTFPRPGLSESDDTVQTRLDGIAEQKGGSSVHLPDSSVHSALRTLVDERFLGRKKVSNILMEETILILCSGHFLTLDQLADFLKRSPETIRTHYLNQMVKRKLLDLKYPDKHTHPDPG
ncbi:MAG: hypothetical protein Q7V05_13135 [Methanoregula sp.]|nr:hypothetical protein [Methanoregula sp.]